jgi:predicted HTH domain antitoxin
MTTLPLAIQDDLAAVLHSGEQSMSDAALELMALELYRRGSISSGKAAEWLGTTKQEFLQHASRLGIAVIQMADDEWQSEALIARSL